MNARRSLKTFTLTPAKAGVASTGVAAKALKPKAGAKTVGEAKRGVETNAEDVLTKGVCTTAADVTKGGSQALAGTASRQKTNSKASKRILMTVSFQGCKVEM